MIRKWTLSRRGFVGASMAALTLGAGLPAWFAREVISDEEERTAKESKPVAPNDRIRLGAIGTGGQGYLVMTEAVKKRPGVELVAACDVDANRRRAAIAKSKLKGVAEYGDFRALLARTDIDAVTVVTPDHWHAPITIAALRAGKDVYCEKPMTLTIDEGKALVKAASSTDRLVQVGTQQRSDPRFRLACELVRNGRIGPIRRVETRVGSNPKHKPLSPSTPPDGLDWNFWLGQAPAVPYIKERCHYDFRWWYEYSGGKLTDWGAHHNDIAQWGLDADGTGPIAVEATNSEVGTSPDSFACPVDFNVTYTYVTGANLICSAKGKNGVLFVGELGWIFVDRAKIEASDPRLLSDPLPSTATRLHSSSDHILNFIDAVRTREKTVCPPTIGHRSATVCHLGNIAIRTGESLRWDPKTERFLDNERANAMLSRPTRPQWRIDLA
ncbi:Predicted dehydrogenase [Singulisphaera sp. GP187]|uniref:Gfo/Idh/MocA family protein n=1 Tax=Singulisphaera sp. GP187 TaxID=1882752 RepID=UPI00092A42D3|nr:Gfo/Idh/MocA family oxidoreductase [Singulisphaera sp. GP187]SIO24679.1 Predicted dehydrogenase [Singulisphaera sp. GP187]